MKKELLLVLSTLVLAAPGAMAQSYNMTNGLPPTLMDSFVYEAGPSADLIYGDEGGDDIPPFQNFTVEHRISSGFYGMNDAGLTTGHGSLMPDAWGGDEFIGAEFSMSGPSDNSTGGGSGLTITVGPNGVTVSGSLAADLPCGVSGLVSGAGSVSVSIGSGCGGCGSGCNGGSGGYGSGCGAGSSGCGSNSAGNAGCGGGSTGCGGCASSMSGCGGCGGGSGCGSGCSGGGCGGGGGCSGGCGGGFSGGF